MRSQPRGPESLSHGNATHRAVQVCKNCCIMGKIGGSRKQYNEMLLRHFRIVTYGNRHLESYLFHSSNCFITKVKPIKWHIKSALALPSPTAYEESSLWNHYQKLCYHLSFELVQNVVHNRRMNCKALLHQIRAMVHPLS